MQFYGKKKFYKELFLNKKTIKKYFRKQEVIFSTKGLFLEQIGYF